MCRDFLKIFAHSINHMQGEVGCGKSSLYKSFACIRMKITMFKSKYRRKEEREKGQEDVRERKRERREKKPSCN